MVVLVTAVVKTLAVVVISFLLGSFPRAPCSWYVYNLKMINCVNFSALKGSDICAGNYLLLAVSRFPFQRGNVSVGEDLVVEERIFYYLQENVTKGINHHLQVTDKEMLGLAYKGCWVTTEGELSYHLGIKLSVEGQGYRFRGVL